MATQCVASFEYKQTVIHPSFFNWIRCYCSEVCKVLKQTLCYLLQKRWTELKKLLVSLCLPWYIVCRKTVTYIKWDKIFKNGPSKILGRQPLKNLKGCRPYPFIFFKGCLLQILLCPFLDTLFQVRCLLLLRSN